MPNALGKGYFALGKAFAEGSTRQRASGKKSVGKEFFAECPTLGKVGTEKNLKKMEKMEKKWNFKILKFKRSFA